MPTNFSFLQKLCVHPCPLLGPPLLIPHAKAATECLFVIQRQCHHRLEVAEAVTPARCNATAHDSPANPAPTITTGASATTPPSLGAHVTPGQRRPRRCRRCRDVRRRTDRALDEVALKVSLIVDGHPHFGRHTHARMHRLRQTTRRGRRCASGRRTNRRSE